MIQFNTDAQFYPVSNGIKNPFTLTKHNKTIAKGVVVVTFDKQYIEIHEHDETYQDEIKNFINRTGLINDIIFTSPLETV